MNESVRKRSVPGKPTGHFRVSPRSLLVPVDLTPGWDRVLGRVALLPLADDARVTLLHVVPGSIPPAAQGSAQREAKKALLEVARHLRKSLPNTIRVEPIVKLGVAAKEIASCAKAVKAELVVMGRGGRPCTSRYLSWIDSRARHTPGPAPCAGGSVTRTCAI
jgi:nucleotide-binding universal stress UspA family protein